MKRTRQEIVLDAMESLFGSWTNEDVVHWKQAVNEAWAGWAKRLADEEFEAEFEDDPEMQEEEIINRFWGMNYG